MSETTDLQSINVLLGDFTVKLMQRDDVTDIWVNADGRIWYRSHDDHVIIASPGWFERDGTGEAWELMKQYASGQLTVREFLASVNQKARMMALEG